MRLFISLTTLLCLLINPLNPLASIAADINECDLVPCTDYEPSPSEKAGIVLVAIGLIVVVLVVSKSGSDAHFDTRDNQDREMLSVASNIKVDPEGNLVVLSW